MEEEAKKESQLKDTTVFLMIGTALFFDSLQALIGWIPLFGNILADLLSIFIFLTFFLWFYMNGIKMVTPKRLSAMVGGTLVEMVPYLNLLPAWTGVVIYLIGTTKIKEIAAKHPTLAKGALAAGGKIKSMNKTDRPPHVPFVDEKNQSKTSPNSMGSVGRVTIGPTNYAVTKNPIQGAETEEWAKLENHKFDENNYYRVVDEKGYQDFKDSGVVRSSPTGTDPKMTMTGRFNIGNRPTPFPSFSKGGPELSYSRKDSDNYIFESNGPMYKRGEANPLHGRTIQGRHYAHRPIDEKTGEVITEMKPEMIKNIYKHDKRGELYLRKPKRRALSTDDK